MSEEKNVANEAVAEEATQNTTQEVAQNEYIAESKKYRKRAQDAEAQLSKLQKEIARQEEDRLKQKEDFKSLYEKVSSQNDSLMKDADRWKSYETNKRNTLLERHPEEERDSLSRLDLETLEYVTNKISTPTKTEVVGRPKVSTPDKNWADMNDEEKRSFYNKVAGRK